MIYGLFIYFLKLNKINISIKNKIRININNYLYS